VQDTIGALVGLMDSPSTSGEIYNVGSQERIRILDLAKRVLEATGSTSELEFIPYDQVYGLGIEDMFHRIPSLDKVAAAIGWKPQRTLDEILADVIAFTRTDLATV
jgi:UDP-glucose 4-epimerase